MPAFPVDSSMDVLYEQLDDMGWDCPGNATDEWFKGDWQIHILHVGSACEIRSRRDPRMAPGWKGAQESHAIDVMLAARSGRAAPWDVAARVYGTSAADFARWLVRVANEINRKEAEHAVPPVARADSPG